MKRIWMSAFAAGVLTLGWGAFTYDAVHGSEVERDAQRKGGQTPKQLPAATPEEAISRGLKWLVSVQGNDGGWGQDGGETSYVRTGENLETSGNDVANTAVAALALIEAGHRPGQGEYGEAVDRAVGFVLASVERSPVEGLAVTEVTGSQIQRKLGPHIDTFLTSMLLSELDGQMPDSKSNERVRLALEKCIHKIESSQLEDGSWNLSGGWAPILGTSIASRSLYLAEQKGVAVSGEVLVKVDDYTKNAAAQPSADAEASGPLSGFAGIVGGRTAARGSVAGDGSDAGIGLYRDAQILEQLSRTEEARERNADEIAAIKDKLSDDRFVEGFGSVGGEEFFSYLNVGESLKRAGGEPWRDWNGRMQTKMVRLQNEDGSWAGHHCITGRVAVTSAAVLNLLAGIS